MGYQKIRLFTDFTNVHMTLVKSAPKKNVGQKTDFYYLGKFPIGKIVICLKLFIALLKFYTRHLGVKITGP
jgi:hypothetical protein